MKTMKEYRQRIIARTMFENHEILITLPEN